MKAGGVTEEAQEPNGFSLTVSQQTTFGKKLKSNLEEELKMINRKSTKATSSLLYYFAEISSLY